MPSVFLTVPNTGWIHSSVHLCVASIIRNSECKIRHEAPQGRPEEYTYHKCMNSFLAGDEDFWCSIDSDNPPKRNPLELVNHELDFIGLPTPVVNSSPFSISWNVSPVRISSANGPQEVEFIGTGCFIVSRRLAEALANKKPFSHVTDCNGVIQMSGDYSFCEKAREAGFKIHADFAYTCGHYKEFDISMIHSAFDLGVANGNT